MNPNINTNYLTNSLSKAQQFLQSTATSIRENIYRSRYGTPMSAAGSVLRKENLPIKTSYQPDYEDLTGSVIKPSVRKTTTNLPGSAAAAVSDLLTDQTRRELWKVTNPFRMAGEVGRVVGERLGMDPVTGAAVAFGTPIVLATLGGRYGGLETGLRPKGYKSVIPVSKEEDPHGKKSISVPTEAALRFGLGQTSQILPWEEFKKERPDVSPSTYSSYKKYTQAKAKPGELISIDPETGTFTTAAGLLRGSAQGLNDPEVRVKGFPLTLSSALGTAAGLAATGLAYKSLPKELRHARSVSDYTGSIKEQVNPLTGEIASGPPKTYYPSSATTAGVLAAGAGTAALVSHVIKKTMQKATERRLKKENPVEYLKHKHGSLEQASATLGLPEAQSWQQLVPHIK